MIYFDHQSTTPADSRVIDAMLPFFREHDFPILAILTGQASPFTGDELHPYESLLALNEIEHRLPEKGIAKINGFLERFKHTASEEFFTDAMQEKTYQELKEVQADFDVWLERYNAERPYFGYPNMGSTPMEMFRVAKQPAPVDSGVKLAPPKTLALRKAPERYTRSRWLFHLVNLLLLALLVNFGVHALLKFRDTKLTPESAPAAAPAVAVTNSPAEARPMTAYQTIWLRDLFGTSKTEVPEPKEDPSIEKLALAQKSLGLKLVGTVVADDPMISRAIIDNRKTREQEAYREGDNAGKVRIKKILRNKVVITTAKGDELLTIEPEEFGKGRQTLRAQRQPATGRARSRVSRQDVEEALANPEEVMGELNISQHMQNEQPSGFRVTGFKSNSILARLGLRNGDVVTDVDGEPVSGPEQAEELFERLVEGGTFAIKIQRRRRPRMLRFNIE